METDRAARLLGRTPLFEGLDDATLFRLAERADERTFRKGELIVQEGHPGGSMFVVSEGLVKVYITSPDGDQMVLVILRPPEVFGELTLIDGKPRSASAEALETTTLLTVTRNAVLDTMAEHPQLSDRLLLTLSALIRRTTTQAADLAFLDLHGRVAKLLVGLAEQRGEQSAEGTVLDLHLTQGDLAGMVGGSRQGVNQILQSFQQRGYIQIAGRRIIVKEPELLKRRAGLG